MDPPRPARDADDAEHSDDDNSTIEARSASEHEIDPEEDEEEEGDDEEPRLKYTRLTKSLGGVYRNGDAVSATAVFGDRMALGTHNGNIHILSLPSLAPLRTYHAHSASVTSLSISPPPPPPLANTTRRYKDAYHDRYISIASSSIDGLVCVVPLLPSTPPSSGQSLTTVPYSKAEITLKNFKRPTLAVELSPNFKADRTFLSGGLAGNLVLSVAPAGGSSGGWMSLGLSGSKDTVLHSGEGTISAISWSKESPRYVAWANEQGIKIMRSHIVPPAAVHKASVEEVAGNPGIAGWIPGLGSGGISAAEMAWKRISAIERPETIPEELASLHKPRLEWIDRRSILTSEPGDAASGTTLNIKDVDWGDKEKLLVGWGGTVWAIDVFPGSQQPDDPKAYGWAEITHIFQTDCIISGIHMYTPSLLLVLAYITNTEEETPEAEVTEDSASGSSSPVAPKRFRRGRTNALTPELRFIDLNTSEEVSADELMMSRFEGLAANDYHLSILPATPISVEGQTEEGESFSGIGAGLWAAAMAPTQLFSGAQSIRSFGSGSRRNSVTTTGTALTGATLTPGKGKDRAAKWGEDEKGTKIYIISPYDVVFATERSQKDHLTWMLDRKQYADAWHLIDRHPEVVDPDTAALSMYDEEERKVVHPDAEYESDSTTVSKQRSIKRYSTAEKEKRRIGELWLKDLIDAHEWTTAGEVCGKVLGTSTRWEYWVWIFEVAKKIDEITPYIPTTKLQPPLPSVIYEIVLAHYLSHDRRRFAELLLDTWKPDGTRTLYDARTLVDTILLKIDNQENDINPGTEDWRLLQECLAKLYMALQEPRNALKRYMMLKNADEAFRLIREFRLVDAIRNDIASLILLRITDKQLSVAPIPELETHSSEAISLLIDEVDRGIVPPHRVVEQLENPKTPAGRVFLYFYLRRLWRSDHGNHQIASSSGEFLAEFEDLMVELFAQYDRPLLLEFLKESHNYSLEKASSVCENMNYIPELVHLLSKTGQTKRALFLIIDRLADVAQAIAFAKQQDDPDLWNDLLDYSMDKPKFIRGLLENVGTAIDPITLVRRIPLGLEIEGLKEALRKILREYGVQWSICDGVSRALNSEVARGQEFLQHGQKRGIKIDPMTAVERPLSPGAALLMEEDGGRGQKCGVCAERFNDEKTILAFACGHIFHVACIAPGKGKDVESAPLLYGRRVAAKVTRAAVIGRSIETGGCQVCAKRKKEEIMV